MSNTVLVLVIVIAIVIIAILVAVFFLTRRQRQAPFERRALPADVVAPTEARIADLERQFVEQPRDAVAGSRQLVDGLLEQMGYPARLNPAERVTDLRHFNSTHADRYRSGASVGDKATTEEMRRALKDHLDTARELISEARPGAGGGAGVVDAAPAEVSGEVSGPAQPTD